MEKSLDKILGQNIQNHQQKIVINSLNSNNLHSYNRKNLVYS